MVKTFESPKKPTCLGCITLKWGTTCGRLLGWGARLRASKLLALKALEALEVVTGGSLPSHD